MGVVRWRLRHDSTAAQRSVLASTTIGQLCGWEGHMNESTKASYRKLAGNFYRSRLAGQIPTPKLITDGLIAAAPHYRPAYWRRLRNALEFDQRERGYPEAAERIRRTVNPVTKQGSQLPVKPKQRRVQSVPEADELRLLRHFHDVVDDASLGAITIAILTGARPAELLSVHIDGGLIKIRGAKKSHEGKRGMDRSLVLNENAVEMVRKALVLLESANIGAIQDRIAAAGRRLWPQRKAWPSLYSWRHQLGSDLKASGLSRVEIAYIMGHQSTESVEQYGNRKTARSGAVLPRAPAGTDFSCVRERHTAGPLPSRAAHDSARVDEEQEQAQEIDWGWDYP